jgi:hypothetical protein
MIRLSAFAAALLATTALSTSAETLRWARAGDALTLGTRLKQTQMSGNLPCAKV